MLDFLETAKGSEDDASSSASTVIASASAVVWSRDTSRTSSGSSGMLHSGAMAVAMDADRQAASNVLHDEIPSSAPWHLQALFCFSARWPHPTVMPRAVSLQKIAATGSDSD